MQSQSPAAVLEKDTLKISKDLKGIYNNNGTRTFLDCEHPELIYRLTSAHPEIDSALKKILPNAYSGEGIYVEMNAEINPIDSKVFSGLLDVKKVLKTEQKNPGNTCIPFDFWCKGTEPFWTLQISKAENLIDFYNPMEQKTSHFLYSAPITKDNVITYTSTDESDPKRKIQVSVFPEKCSDGMSEKQYNYRVEIILEKKYKGCGMKFGERN